MGGMTKIGLGLTLAGLLTIGAADVHAETAPVAAHLVFAPQIVPASDGLRHLAYELEIDNFYDSTGVLKLAGVDVFADGSAKPLAHVTGSDLAALLPPNAELEPDNTLAIKAGGHAVILIWLTLPGDGAAPRILTHHLEFRTPSGAVQTVDGVAVRVDATPPVIIGPPLRGGLWLADEGPGNAQSHHWGSLIADNGRLTIPQRYAIDLFGLDAKGHAVAAPIDKLAQSRLTDWAGFDSEIVAVADGVVRDVQDGVPAHNPLAQQDPAGDLTPKALYGNYVILEIAPNVFVHYAHLNTGSVAVKIGDHVKRGDVLGHLGDTGQAGAPHLHIHVSNSVGFADSEGLPFEIDAFTLTGRGTESDALNAQSDMHLAPAKAKPVHDAMPLNGDILGF